MPMGSHTGSFAGGFIKSFLAVAQMAMRKRQLDDMHEYYMAMRDQMRMNMATQNRLLGLGQEGRDRARGNIESFDADNRAPKGALDQPPDLSKADPKVVSIIKDEFGKKGIDPNTALTVFKGEALDGYKIGEKDTGGDGGTSFSPFQLHFGGGLADIAKEQGIDPRDSSEAGIRKSAAFAADWVSKHGWGDFNGRQSGGVGRWDGITGAGGKQASAIDTRDSASAKTFLASVSDHADRPGDTSNMQPEFATRMAAAIKQANAEGIPARLGSGFREPDQLLKSGDHSQAAYFDARGGSEHSKGYAGDVAGIGEPGSPTARRWSEIANANGLSVPYGYDNKKEWNHTELAGLTSLRGAQPANASRSMVAGPGTGDSSNILPPTTLKPDQFVTGGPESAAAEAKPPAAPINIPIGGGPGNVLSQAPAGPQLPSQATPATAAPAAAPIPSRGAPQPPLGPAPGTVQSNVGGVRGQQPGAGGPIYTTGQFGPLTQSGQPAPQQAPPAPALPSTTGTPAPAIPPSDPRTGQRPQQVPPSATPLPPTRPDNMSGASDTSGNIVTPATAGGQNVGVGGGTGDTLWAGYNGASPEQAASADPLNNLYSQNQAFAASSGLTDTTGLMAAGAMDQMASMDDSDLTATMYKGGPVVKYYKGGVIKRYQDGGDVDSSTSLPQPEPTPSSAGGSPLPNADRDTMIRTIAAEAGRELPIGQAAVAHTIFNRVADGGYGDGVQGVIKKPGEFSSWNGVTGFAHGQEASPLVTAPASKIPNYGAIGSIVDKVHNGLIPDPTNGATHYYAPAGMPGGRPPAQWPKDWFNAAQKTKVGTQIFVGGSQGPGQTIPTQMAGYYHGGIIKRYAAGGDTDEDLLADYGGTDTSDPMANSYWDKARVDAITNNSDPSGIPDLPTAIQDRAAQPQQGDQPITAPPLEPANLGSAIAPAEQPAPSAAPTDQPAPSAAPTDQPAPPTDDRDQRSQSDIPPGSVQVAGPGGWGSVGKGGSEYTHIPMPRVGGMGMGSGPRMRGPSISSMGRMASVGKGQGQPLYVPGYAGGNDYNHIGIAPTYNPDGSASPWLLNMVGNGIRALFTGFGLANQGAMPGSPEQRQNLIDFGNHPGVDSEDMHALGKLYDPHGDFVEGAAEIGGAVSMIKYYALTGNLDAASRLSGGVLLYTRMISMEYGDQAVKSLFKGDYKGAVNYLEKAHGWVPDGKTSSGEVVDEKTGRVHAQLKDGNGNVLDEQDYMPAAIMEAALGAKNGTSYWKFLSGLAAAGNNDPIGSHIQLQNSLRKIQGNEDVPLDPFSQPPKNLPIGSGATPPPPTAPDTTTAPPTQTDTTTPPATAPSDSTVSTPPTTPPAISPRDAGGVGSGQATAQPPPTAQPPTAMASRGDISNLVAGPGAPSTTQAQPPTQGGSGSVLVAQEKARAQQAEESQVVQRMVQGGAYDPDDPYIAQKQADLEKQLQPLQTYRTGLENQLSTIEGSTMNPQDKKAMQTAILAKIKNFDETSWKPAVKEAQFRLSQVSNRIKEQFRVQMAQAQDTARQQAVIAKEKNAQETAYATAQMNNLKPVGPNDEQMRTLHGVKADGSPATNPDGSRIPSMDEEVNTPFGTKGSDGKTPLNSLELYGQANPFLSSSYVPGKPDTFDMHQTKDMDGNNLFSPSNRKTMTGSAEDIVKMNRGIGANDAKDYVYGLATGNYKILSMGPHQMPRSPTLTNKDAPDIIDENGRIRAPDGIERYDVVISRGNNDPGTTVIMSKNEAAKLGGLREDAYKLSSYNRDIYNAKQMPNDQTIQGPGPAIAPEAPKVPQSASNSQEQPPPVTALPPRELTPGSDEMTEYLRTHPPQGPPHLQFNPKTAIPSDKPWDQPINIQ